MLSAVALWLVYATAAPGPVPVAAAPLSQETPVVRQAAASAVALDQRARAEKPAEGRSVPEPGTLLLVGGGLLGLAISSRRWRRAFSGPAH